MDVGPLRHRLHSAFKSTVEALTPPRSASAFRSRGVLTPDEFVAAGDNLVTKCPTWAWEGGDASRRRPFLPPHRQFLITRNVPCLRRAGYLEEAYAHAGGDLLLEADGGDGGWLATHGNPAADVRMEEAIPSIDAQEGRAASELVMGRGGPSGNLAADDAAENDDDVPDMTEFEEEDNAMESDPATLSPSYLVAREPTEDHILRTRTYDISITYDKYYQTPRVWLFGYDESRQPLKPEQVLEDVSQDHARKTVTIDDHPNMPGKFASVHPCRHGAVMKKILDVLTSSGVEPRIDQYLFIFLKFIASLIPTIEYDYTVDFDLSKQVC
eukprot:SM000211S06651  [mRNA]  locus=s211:181288:183297:- [translate_table: standard]